MHRSRPQRVDYRTRADRLLRQQEAWSIVYPEMLQSYLEWDCNGAPTFVEDTHLGDRYAPILIFDFFGMSFILPVVMFVNYF